MKENRCKLGDVVKFERKPHVVAQIIATGSKDTKDYIAVNPIYNGTVLTRTIICAGVDWEHCKGMSPIKIKPKKSKEKLYGKIIRQLVTYKGVTKPLIDFIHELGLNRNTVVKRLNSNKKIEEILSNEHLPNAWTGYRRDVLPVDISRVQDYMRSGRGLEFIY